METRALCSNGKEANPYELLDRGVALRLVEYAPDGILDIVTIERAPAICHHRLLRGQRSN